MSAMDENLIQEMAAEAVDPASVAADPITQFRRWYAQAHSAGIPREDAMTLASMRRGRRARRPDRALQRLKQTWATQSPAFPSSRTMRATRPLNLHATQEPPSSSTGSPPPGRSAPKAFRGKTAGRDFRRLFRLPSARQPDRRVGIAPEPRGPLPRLYRSRKSAPWKPDTQAARRAASSPLGRLHPETPLGRILAAPRQPPPRPRALHAGRRSGGVARREAGAVVPNGSSRKENQDMPMKNPPHPGLRRPP